MSENQKKKTIRQRIISWEGLLFGLIALVMLGVAAFVIFQPIKVLPRMQLAPGFALTDEKNERLTNEDMRGQFVMYNFTHTGCRSQNASNSIWP